MTEPAFLATGGRRIPPTKAARHARIRDLLSHNMVRSQPELGQLLLEDGLTVTQATLSRDLVELGASKVRVPGVGLVYAIPDVGLSAVASPTRPVPRDARLGHLCEDLLVTAEAASNLVVLRTPPGAAQLLASAIDQSQFAEVLGTIAGDDTVLVVARDPAAGVSIASALTTLAARRDEH
ncbi:MAG: arginine repressor [Actinomycetales bacterium]